MSAEMPMLDDVLESFLLESTEPNALQRYLEAYPDYARDLVDLAHAIALEPVDETLVLGPNERLSIERAVEKASAAWPAEAVGQHDLFAALGPSAYGKLARELAVPLQVVAAVRNRRAIPDTIPRGFLRRMASALSGTIDDLLFSIEVPRAVASNYKATERPVAQAPVPFEQILIEARVPEERRLEILADHD